MKKRSMKKYIPKGNYCYGRIIGRMTDNKGLKTAGNCKNLIRYKLIKDSILAPKELGSDDYIEVPTEYWVYKCRYTDITTEADALLYDSCKVCGVRMAHE